MSCNKLDLHLCGDFGFEDVCEVSKLVRSTAHELIQVDELRHIFLLLSESFKEWLFIMLNPILTLAVLSHRYSLADRRSSLVSRRLLLRLLIVAHILNI